MKFKFHFTGARLITDDSGNMELSLSISPQSKYNVHQIAREIKGVECTATVTEKKKSRSLDQNNLMWALLTIYADAENGGRKGGTQPEDIYYRMLSKYGVAEFLVIPCDAVEGLKRAYKETVVIDDAVIERNGKRTPAKAVKCLIGSSQYDTKQMTQLIDGIFDELAVIGVDASTSREVSDYYTEWKVKGE